MFQKDEEAELLQQLFLETQAAQDGNAVICARSESGSTSSHTPESQSSSTPSQHLKTTSLWAPLLKNHLRDHHVDPESEDVTPRVVVSACAGVCSEAEVLSAPGLSDT